MEIERNVGPIGSIAIVIRAFIRSSDLNRRSSSLFFNIFFEGPFTQTYPFLHVSNIVVDGLQESL